MYIKVFYDILCTERIGMDYAEFTRNIGKAGLKIGELANLLNVNPNSITNLKLKPEVPKHWAIIAVLLGEMKDNGLDYRPALEKLDLKRQESKVRNDGRFGGDKQRRFKMEA